MTTLNPATTVQSPERLCEKTRCLAAIGLSGEWGRELRDADPALLTRIPDTDDNNLRSANAVRLIAETAPVRLMDGCRIVGSAPYREAPWHKVPILNRPGTSHTTIGFEQILRTGYRGVRRRIAERRSRGGLDERQENFLTALDICLDAAGIWQRRYLDHLESLASPGKSDDHWSSVLSYNRNVPENPAVSFIEAVQSLWWAFSFQRLCGNWSGIGRIDKMLGPFLESDLVKGVITLNEAREMLAHFWIMGTEWIGCRNFQFDGGSGDAQYYQNVVLGGCDEEGVDVTNEVTYLVLDIVEELHISDFPVAVRINEDSDPRLLERIAEVSSRGGGIVSVYNETVCLAALDRLGISTSDARDFANDGCWEIIIPGKTAFRYLPFDVLGILQRTLRIGEGDVPGFTDFESLYGVFKEDLGEYIDEVVHLQLDGSFRGGGGGRENPLLSLLVDDCIEKARGYHDRGAGYTIGAPHAGGLPDVVNSLAVIRKLVYERHELTLAAFVDILRNDWDGHEDLKSRIRRECSFYGNDFQGVDALMVRVYDDFTETAWRNVRRDGMLRPPGISTFGRAIEWREHRTASPHGFRKEDILSTNFSPTPGTDREGPTAILKSYCAVDFTKLPNGGTLEIKLHPSAAIGVEGVKAMVGLFRTFLNLGGCYMNIDVMDADLLRDAQRHPDRYPNLAVRISGWCARFNTLSEEWQELVIRNIEGAC